MICFDESDTLQLLTDDTSHTGEQLRMNQTESKRIVFSVTLLRALAACIITNAHYVGVYPHDIIASGGLLGDVIFFGVSGFCLSRIRKSFFPWYGKRLYRCYLPTLLITAIYLAVGFYSLSEHGAVWWFVFPTAYHFVASIVLLYIPYYFVMVIRPLREHLPAVMAVIGAAAGVVYLFFYDKSYYHIDNVREPFVEFLFFESMLIGAYFSQNRERFLNKNKFSVCFSAIVLFVLYFITKTFFSRYERYAALQLINQLVLIGLLYASFRCALGFDVKTERMPAPVKKTVSFLAEITLEIYVVQYAIIPTLAHVAEFPINWLIITAAILASAFSLHMLCRMITASAGRISGAIRRSRID